MSRRDQVVIDFAGRQAVFCGSPDMAADAAAPRER